EWPGVQIIMNATRIGGAWARRDDSMFKSGGEQNKDKICVQALDDKFAQETAPFHPPEPKRDAEGSQKGVLEEYYFVPVFRHAFLNAIGPRVKAAKWQDVFPTALTTGYAYPWEDIELKETAAAEK